MCGCGLRKPTRCRSKTTFVPALHFASGHQTSRARNLTSEQKQQKCGSTIRRDLSPQKYKNTLKSGASCTFTTTASDNKLQWVILHLFRVVEKRILCSPSRYGFCAALHAALQPFLGGAKHSSHQAPEQGLEYFHVQYAAVLCVVYQAQAKDNNKPSSLTPR